MQFYGNEHTQIDAITLGDDNNYFHMRFPSVEKEAFVPKSSVHTLPQISPIPQRIEIDTWFLKRNRIIPLGK